MLSPELSDLDLHLASDRSVLKRWTVEDYHRMGDLGLLESGIRTELIAGQIMLLAPKGTAHVTTVQLFAAVLRERIGNHALIRTQDPIRLDLVSEPEPDLAIVRGSVLDYLTDHPRPEQILLIVEVADSSLKQDCQIKAKLYAQAGITDYWVVDINDRQLHVFRDPIATAYSRHLILTEPHSISPLAFPDLPISLGSILPPILPQWVNPAVT